MMNGNGEVIGDGVLEITANYPFPIHLSMFGKEYVGLWHAARVHEDRLAMSRRRLSLHAYVTYEAGNDPAQLEHGYASLAAADGSEIQCDFYYRGLLPGKGSCEVDGKKVQLTVQRHSSAADGMTWG